MRISYGSELLGACTVLGVAKEGDSKEPLSPGRFHHPWLSPRALGDQSPRGEEREEKGEQFLWTRCMQGQGPWVEQPGERVLFGEEKKTGVAHPPGSAARVGRTLGEACGEK